jgi:hypothetical protein
MDSSADEMRCSWTGSILLRCAFKAGDPAISFDYATGRGYRTRLSPYRNAKAGLGSNRLTCHRQLPVSRGATVALNK